MRHTGADHEERLAAVLRDAQDAAAALQGSELAACPACAELVELEQELTTLAAHERDALAAAHAPLPEGRAEQALRARMEHDLSTSARPARRRRTLWILAAAAALVATLLWPRGERPAEPDLRLGTTLELEAPLGRVPDFTLFRWQAVEGAAWYRVRVESLDPATNGAESESGRLSEPRWQPEPEERARWGRHILWTVEAFRATGASDLLGASRAASAELSSP